METDYHHPWYPGMVMLVHSTGETSRKLMDEWAGACHFPNHVLRILKARGMKTGWGSAGINLPAACPWRMARTTIHNYLLVNRRGNTVDPGRKPCYCNMLFSLCFSPLAVGTVVGSLRMFPTLCFLRQDRHQSSNFGSGTTLLRSM